MVPNRWIETGTLIGATCWIWATILSYYFFLLLPCLHLLSFPPFPSAKRSCSHRQMRQVNDLHPSRQAPGANSKVHSSCRLACEVSTEVASHREASALILLHVPTNKEQCGLGENPTCWDVSLQVCVYMCGRRRKRRRKRERRYCSV